MKQDLHDQSEFGEGGEAGEAVAPAPVAAPTSQIAAALRRAFCFLIAPDDDRSPLMRHRAIVFPLVFVPWLILYEWVVCRGPAPAAFQTYLPGEIHWPIWQWTEIFYVSPYLLVPLAPLLARTNHLLRRFVIAGLIATVVVFCFFLALPAIAPPRPFHPSGILGRMMLTDRMLDRNNGTAAFPSFHVVWAFLGAAVFAAGLGAEATATRLRRRARAGLRALCWGWAAMVAASCIFTGMHSLSDVLAGFIVFLLVWNYAGLQGQRSPDPIDPQNP